MGNENKYVSAAKVRIGAVRLRTWILTSTILVGLFFWIILAVTTRDTISWIDFVMMITVQTLGHFAYFPDGEIFGQQDEKYKAWKSNYDRLANDINNDDKYYRLREYCAFEYEERKAQYINTILGYIGITEKEFDEIKLMGEKEIKELKEFEITEKVNGEDTKRIVYFNKHKRRMLCDLIFKPIPVERNEADTIVNGKKIDPTQEISDKTDKERVGIHIARIFRFIIVGVFIAYISWNVKDGYNWITDTAKLITYIGALFISAIRSFTSGERIQKVYKTEFYIELSQFIEKFNEWDKTH